MTISIRAGTSTDGYVVVAGTDVISINSAGNVTIPLNLPTTSANTGSLIVAGGVGIAGALNVGGNLTGTGLLDGGSY
jgi:hypothetical protein